MPPKLFKRWHNPNPNSRPRGVNNIYFNSNFHLSIHWFFQRLNPFPEASLFEFSNLSKIHYFLIIWKGDMTTMMHKLCKNFIDLHLTLVRRALLICPIVLIFKLPRALGWQKISHLTKLFIDFSLEPDHKKFVWIFSRIYLYLLGGFSIMLIFTSELGVFMSFLGLGSIDNRYLGLIVANGLTRSRGFKARSCL